LVVFDYPISGARSEPAEQMRLLRASGGQGKLVVLTTELNFVWVTTALSSGVDGYLLKDMSPEAFIQSLRLVLLGERVLPTDLAVLLMSGRFQMANQIAPTMPAQNLSPREVQILHCLLRGDSNKLIANRLQITEGTVKVHLKGVLKKINVRNRTQAAIWALNNGFIGQTAPVLAVQNSALERRVT
jgi:two-component system nitrate/nitrite response regulator NarL